VILLVVLESGVLGISCTGEKDAAFAQEQRSFRK
jgi:hypothetical protein